MIFIYHARSGPKKCLQDDFITHSEDTLFRGTFCGAIAGILKDSIDYIFYAVNTEGVFFWSFASVIAFGKLPKGLFPDIFGLTLEIIFSAFLGFIYAGVTKKIKARHYLINGIFFGSMVWFLIRAAIVGYKINELKTVGIPVRPFITWFLSLVYGITLAWLERKLSPKTS